MEAHRKLLPSGLLARRVISVGPLSPQCRLSHGSGIGYPLQVLAVTAQPLMLGGEVAIHLPQHISLLEELMLQAGLLGGHYVHALQQYGSRVAGRIGHESMADQSALPHRHGCSAGPPSINAWH